MSCDPSEPVAFARLLHKDSCTAPPASGCHAASHIHYPTIDPQPGASRTAIGHRSLIRLNLTSIEVRRCGRPLSDRPRQAGTFQQRNTVLSSSLPMHPCTSPPAYVSSDVGQPLPQSPWVGAQSFGSGKRLAGTAAPVCSLLARGCDGTRQPPRRADCGLHLIAQLAKTSLKSAPALVTAHFLSARGLQPWKASRMIQYIGPEPEHSHVIKIDRVRWKLRRLQCAGVEGRILQFWIGKPERVSTLHSAVRAGIGR